MAPAQRYGKLKKISLIIVVIFAAFFVYVEIANRNSTNMTYRQKVLKTIYPLWMWWTNLRGKNTATLADNKQPPVSFYSLKSKMNNGEELDFSSFKNKKVMLVNTASGCGYTDQYADLQKLADKFPGKLVVLAFPANDYKNQEEGTDSEIAAFCKANYGISFPLMQKSSVRRGPDQNAVYKWLTDSAMNGWNNKTPLWNFTKYLVNENGVLTNYFGPSVSPLSKTVIKSINP